MFIEILLVFLGILLGLAIAYLVFSRKRVRIQQEMREPVFSMTQEQEEQMSFTPLADEIIAVRKYSVPEIDAPEVSIAAGDALLQTCAANFDGHDIGTSAEESNNEVLFTPRGLVIIYLFARPNRQFSGYELLQSLSAAGMCYGEMNIFHYYQELTGTGQILFSLASATEPGTFDIQNMGGLFFKGLTFFMRCSSDEEENIARFSTMVDTALQLAEDLGADLFDEQRKPLTEVVIKKYKNNKGPLLCESH